MAFADPASGGKVVVPSDTVDLIKPARSLYIGTGGDLKVTTPDGSTLSFVGLGGGTILPVSVTRVFATGQAGAIAANIIALY
jgi:hypothetical protein